MHVSKTILGLLVVCGLMGAYQSSKQFGTVYARHLIMDTEGSKYSGEFTSNSIDSAVRFKKNTKGKRDTTGIDTTTRGYLGLSKYGTVMVLYDEKGKARLQINGTDDGSSSFVVLGVDGKPVWGVWADKDGKVTTLKN